MMKNKKLASNYPQKPAFSIDTIEALRLLTDVRRLSILELLVTQPLTVKEISTRLKIQVNKLYYHIKLLEEQGMIQVVETHVVSGIIEKTYLAVAQSFQVSEDLLRVRSPELDEQIEGVVMTVLDRVRSAFAESAAAGLFSLAATDNPETEQTGRGVMLDNRLVLNREKFHQFQKKLEALIDEFSGLEVDPAAGERVYTFFALGFPNVDEGDDEEIAEA